MRHDVWNLTHLGWRCFNKPSCLTQTSATFPHFLKEPEGWSSAPPHSPSRKICHGPLCPSEKNQGTQDFSEAKAENKTEKLKHRTLAERSAHLLCYHSLASTQDLMNLLEVLFCNSTGFVGNAIRRERNALEREELKNSKISFPTSSLQVKGS